MTKFYRNDLWLHKKYDKEIGAVKYDFCLVNVKNQKAHYITSSEEFDIDKNDLHEAGVRTSSDIDRIESDNLRFLRNDPAVVDFDPTIDHGIRSFFYANYVKVIYNDRLIDVLEGKEVLNKIIITKEELTDIETDLNKYYEKRLAIKLEKDAEIQTNNENGPQPYNADLISEARSGYPEGFNEGAELTLKTK